MPLLTSPSFESTGSTEIDSVSELRPMKIDYRIVIKLVSILAGGATVIMLIKHRKELNVKSLLIHLIPISIIFVLLVLLFFIPVSQSEDQQQQLPDIPHQTIEKTVPVSIDEMPPIFLWIAAVLVIATVIVFIVLLIKPEKKKKSILETLEKESIRAQIAIQQGENAKDVIVNYYRQLCTILFNERDIKREDFSTAREFNLKLTGLGAPADPINSLTALFENARYSKHDLSQKEVNLSLACLNEIIESFRNQREAFHE